jgi:hypothetical protein
MLLKAIRCQISPEEQAKFAEGQQRWAALAELPGFISQQGGWNDNDAWVFGWWQDWQHYSAFMAEQHDPIYAQTQQAASIQKSEISFWQSLPSAQLDRTRNLCADGQAHVILIEMLQLAPGAWADFDDFLKWRWRPGLAGAAGLATAQICQHRKLPGKYLACSRWLASADPVGMGRLLQPGFKLPHRRTQLFKSLAQSKIRIEPDWQVDATRPMPDSQKSVPPFELD